MQYICNIRFLLIFGLYPKTPPSLREVARHRRDGRSMPQADGKP